MKLLLLLVIGATAIIAQKNPEVPGTIIVDPDGKMKTLEKPKKVATQAERDQLTIRALENEVAYWRGQFAEQEAKTAQLRAQWAQADAARAAGQHTALLTTLCKEGGVLTADGAADLQNCKLQEDGTVVRKKEK